MSQINLSILKYMVMLCSAHAVLHGREVLSLGENRSCVRCEILVAVLMKIQVFWYVTPCRLPNCYLRFEVA